MNYDFTAKMEERLDDIAEGERQWTQVLDNFYTDFSTQLMVAGGDESEGGMRQNQMVETDIDCPTCGRKMGIRTASTGVFLGCTGYNLPPKERCTTTMNLTPGEEAVNADEVEDVETSTLMQMKRCPKCETAMDSYLIDEGRKLHVCGNNPGCSGYVIEQGQFKLKGYDGPIIECDKCGSDMELKNGRFGKYFGCTNEECKNTRKLLKNGEAAPPKEIRCIYLSLSVKSRKLISFYVMVLRVFSLQRLRSRNRERHVLRKWKSYNGLKTVSQRSSTT